MCEELKYYCEQDMLCGVRIAKDANALSELEQKHLPVITARARIKRNEPLEVIIEVGKHKAHPNEPGHFIEWIELYSDNTFLFRVSLSGSLSQPRITIPVKLTHTHGPLRARAKCNMHGLWEGTKDIEVED